MAKMTGISAISSTVLKNDLDTFDFSIFSEMTATIQMANETTTIITETKDAINSLFSQRRSKISNSESRMMVDIGPFFIFKFDKY